MASLGQFFYALNYFVESTHRCNMAINDWPAEERPREKLLQRGPDALTDAELLAIFLRTGSPGKSAVDLARDLLGQFGSLRALLSADLPRFCQCQIRTAAGGNGNGQAAFSGSSAARRCLDQPGNDPRLSVYETGRVCARSVRLSVSGQPASHHRAGRNVPCHHRRRQRLSTGSRQAGLSTMPRR